MNRRAAILVRLVEAVQLLGDLVDDFIFVGGSAVPLLVTDEGAPDARPTKDIDVVVHVMTRSQYYEIEQRLQKVGFHLDITSGILCRFKNGALILDVMPTDEDILKFGNEWYKQAPEAPITYQLLEARTIKTINAPLFLCTKYAAYQDRGDEDEKDLEDIISIIDGRRELIDEVSSAAPEVRGYIATCTKKCLDAGLAARLEWFLPSDAAGAARESIVLARLKQLAGPK